MSSPPANDSTAAPSAPASAARLTLTIVVAGWPTLAGVEDALAALGPQLDPDTQVFVVSAAIPSAALQARFPEVKWVAADSSELIPHLWARGIRLASSSAVAITTSHFIPAPDWVAQLRAAFARAPQAEFFGIGGLIDPPQDASPANWATYFLRYSSQFRFRGETRVSDTAGDNVAYRLTDLRRHEASFAEGFWEPEFHRTMARHGSALLFAPAVRVRQARCFGLAGFCRQRFDHGQHFGRDRMQDRPDWQRFAAIALSPLIPVILGAKVARNVLHRPRLLPAFLYSSPVLALFVLSWAAGETLGYLTARHPRIATAGA